MYSGLLEHTNFLSEEVGKILDGLKVVRFSESQTFLDEEKNHLIQECKKIMGDLREIKEVISQQTDRKTTIITPLQRKIPKKDYCYFCDVSIMGDFSYKLKAEEQKAYGVEIPEGAAEKVKIREKVERDRKEINEIQGQITNFTERINRLKRKEKELELLPESNPVEHPKKVGFFRRIGQSLRLVKKPNPLSKLERVKKLKEELNIQLENSEKRLKRKNYHWQSYFHGGRGRRTQKPPKYSSRKYIRCWVCGRSRGKVAENLCRISFRENVYRGLLPG
ncbi:254_t:CDS:2 [Funneliformis geosporum]|uniref:254_t:CDS:1 n=1 Tax=Funneliformis geosporum TaxID=1117311 RepID=A0A9W4SLT2_9GLOM|nr:254_t:CDS:2 [Funneliformis geosporum]